MATRSVDYRVDLESNMRSMKENIQTMMKQIERLIEITEKKRGGVESSRSMAFESRKLEIPTFNGNNPDEWILKAEKYFALKCLNNEEQLEVSASLFEGVALRWFRWENQRRLFRRWEDMKRMLLCQFRSTTGYSPGKPFLTLKTGVAIERDNTEKNWQGKKVENMENGKEGEDAKEGVQNKGRAGSVDGHLVPLLMPSTSSLKLLSPSQPPLPSSSTPLSSALPLSSIHPLLKQMNVVSVTRTQSRYEESLMLSKSVSGSLIWPKPKAVGLIWPKPIIDLNGCIKVKSSTNLVSLTASGGDWLGTDHQKLPPPLPPPHLPLPLPPPLPIMLPPSVNLCHLSSIPGSTEEAIASFNCSIFSPIVLGRPLSNSLEVWSVAQCDPIPIPGISEYRRFMHKDDFPDNLSHKTANHRGIILLQNLLITLRYLCGKGKIGFSGRGPEIVEVLLMSVEGPKMGEKLGYAETYTKSCWDRDFGPYFYDSPFTVTPKVVQIHQTSGGQGLAVSNIVRLLQWQVGKKQHDKFESLDPSGDLQAGISVNQSLEVDQTLVLLDCQIEDDESTRPEFEVEGSQPFWEPNGEVQCISTECVWFERVPKTFVGEQFIDIEAVETASESTRLKPSADPLSVGIYREHLDGDIKGKKGNIKRFSCEAAEMNVGRQEKSQHESVQTQIIYSFIHKFRLSHWNLFKNDVLRIITSILQKELQLSELFSTDTWPKDCKEDSMASDGLSDFTDGIDKLIFVGNRRIVDNGANSQVRWNKNYTVIGRLEGLLHIYNFVASRLTGNRTPYLALNETYEGLDTRSEVEYFNDERKNEVTWRLGTKDTSLLVLKSNRRDLQFCEVFWRALSWGTIHSFCYTYDHRKTPLVFNVNSWDEFLFDYFPP